MQLKDAADAVLTARVCQSNAEQFPDILRLYVPPPARVLDMTWGKGVFWKHINHRRSIHVDHAEPYEVWANDIDPERGDFSYDFRQLPSDWEGLFDACVLDPPYMPSHGGAGVKDALDKSFGLTKTIQRDLGMIFENYTIGMAQARRVLRKKGVLILKCQDQVDGGKNRFIHCWLWQYLAMAGWLVEDMFIMVRPTTPIMRHKRQDHARKNHSFWIVATSRNLRYSA